MADNFKMTPELQRLAEKAKADGVSMKDLIKRESMSLIDAANNTFRELSTTLNNEQTKLLELEEKRKRLLNEMIDLKAEIEREKEICRRDLEAANSVEYNVEGIDSADILSPSDIQKRLSELERNSERRRSSDSRNSTSSSTVSNRKSVAELADDITRELKDIVKRESNQKP